MPSLVPPVQTGPELSTSIPIPPNKAGCICCWPYTSNYVHPHPKTAHIRVCTPGGERLARIG
eukprot:2745662-Rhodomonas_salina.2